MSRPNVSIITAVFDGEKYIRECLLSVQIQTNSDFEHIIIDDNSNDNTVKIIKDLIKDDLRFKLFELKVNVGSGKARNLFIYNDNDRTGASPGIIASVFYGPNILFGIIIIPIYYFYL